MVTRFSTLNVYQNTVGNALDIQQRIINISQQVSSGNKAQNFQGLSDSGGVLSYVNLQNELTKMNAYTNNNAQLSGKLDTTSKSLGSIMDLAGKTRDLIAQARNSSTSGSLAFTQQMQSYFQQFAQQLNSTAANGTYLFSGTRIDQPAIDASKYPTTDTPGVANAFYYQGNSSKTTATIADDETVTTNVTGDNIGFQQIVASFAAAKTGFDTKNDDILSKAFTLMQNAINNLNATQTTVNATAAQVTQANSISAAQITYMTASKSDLVSADVVSLSTELAQNQAILMASFQSFSSINKLQLSQYL